MPVHDWTTVGAGLFHHFHIKWISSLTDALNHGALPKGYYALAEQSVGGPIPDVLTLQRGPRSSDLLGPPKGLALMESPPRTKFTYQAKPAVYADRAYRIDVYNPIGEIVAIVEIVSPGNKSSRFAIKQFVRKAVAFLRHGVNLLIVDLFPPTKRDPQGIHKLSWDRIHDEPFVLPAGKPLILVSYYSGDLKRAFVEPVAVGDQLTEMPLFIDDEIYVHTPLESSYQTTWNLCPEPYQQAVMGTLEPG